MTQEAQDVLQAPTFDLFQSRTTCAFKGRPTMSLLIIHRFRSTDRVVLLKTTKGGNWMFPQGEIIERDVTPYAALVRNGFDQFGLKDSHIQTRAALGEFVNEMPEDRNVRRKHVFVVGVRVSSMSWLTPRGKKYEKDPAWVEGAGELVEFTKSNNRSCKFSAMCEAVDRAHKAGLLSWSCDPKVTH